MMESTIRFPTMPRLLRPRSGGDGARCSTRACWARTTAGRRAPLRPTRRRPADRQGAAARHQRHAGRRSRRADGRHDDGLGPGRPRCRSWTTIWCELVQHAAAGAEDRRRRQVVSEGSRTPGRAVEGDRGQSTRDICRCRAECLKGPYLDLVPGRFGPNPRARERGTFQQTWIACWLSRSPISLPCGLPSSGRWHSWNTGSGHTASDHRTQPFTSPLAASA